MVKHGKKPYLECSSKGDKRFSAFYARIRGRGNLTIEALYQAAKLFEDGATGLTWRDAKGRQAINQEEVTALYSTLWDEYITENPDLLLVLQAASGLQDMFGQAGHCCQATELWRIRFMSKQLEFILRKIIMAARKKDEIYAYARGVFEGNFGHLNIHVHEMFGYGSTTLKISCQTGGISGQTNSYAWEHGLSNDYSVLGLDTLKRGYWAMLRTDRLLRNMSNGGAETFADYAIRVLQAFGVRRVYVNPRVNGGLSGKVTDLPCFSPIKDYDALHEVLYAVETDLISRSR